MNLIATILILVFLFAPSRQLPTNSNDGATSDIRRAVTAELEYSLMDFLSMLNYGSANFPLIEDDGIQYILVSTDLNVTDFDSMDPDRPVKIIIAGWLQNMTDIMYTKLNTQYLGHGQYNIINIDWTKYSFNTAANSARYVPLVGEAVGRFIVHLHDDTGVPYGHIHLIGHSFGAQIASVAAMTVHQITGEKVSRVTGLDVLHFIFSGAKIWNRFGSQVAEVVDAVHTNSLLSASVYPVATVDFYVNEGMAVQPGCSVVPSRRIDSFMEYANFAMCSQYASILYYAESIKNSSMYGTKCDSWEDFEEGNCDGNEKAVFGEYLNPGADGKYYLYYNSSVKIDSNVQQQDVSVEQNHDST